MSVITKRNVAASKANAKLLRRVLIWRAAKANPGLKAPGLADLLGMPEHTVRRVMKLRDASPKELLEALEIEAVRSWRDAIPIAGRKGDHRPAKDLLLHTRAIQPIADTAHTGVTVLIGSVVMPGLSRLSRDSNDELLSVFDSSCVDVANTCVDEPTPPLLGADGRDGDPPGGSG